MSNTKFDVRLQQAYLKALRVNGLLSKSAHAVDLSPETIRIHRAKDPDFEVELQEALNTYRDSLETEAHRRGVEGISKDVYYKGQVVGQELQYSDRMLELKLKRNIPEYRDKGSLDVSVSGGVLVVPKAAESSEDWEQPDPSEPKEGSD